MPPRSIAWIAVAALVNAAMAALTAQNLVALAEGEDWGVVVPTAALAVGMLTALGVWLLLRRPVTVGRPWLRGVLVGIAVAILSHPLTWYLFMLFSWVTGRRGSLGDATMNPLEAIPASFLYGAFSLFLAGPLPFVLSGAVCSATLWLWARRSAPSLAD